MPKFIAQLSFKSVEKAGSKEGYSSSIYPYTLRILISIEILWRKLKYDWLNPQDYTEPDKLFYSVTQALTAVGKSLNINFADFALN